MRKVSISGKGGTGKSVLTTLLATVLVEDGNTVLVIDADESNPGLYRMLGFNKFPCDLVDLLGGRKQTTELVEAKIDRTDIAKQGEGLMKGQMALQDIPSKYLLGKNGLKLVTVGKITAAFEGCACPLATVLKIFLDKLVLEQGEFALVDMEAGVEHFGRGVEKNIDTLLILVEPSFESIALASKMNFLGQASRVKNIGAVINKVATETIDMKLQQELRKRNIRVIGSIPYDEQISESCLEGKHLAAAKAKEAARKIVTSIFYEAKQ